MEQVIEKRKVNVFWFRRDLRLHDNHGLYQALKQDMPVVAVFIFDKNILDKLPSKTDMRVSFIYEQVRKLKEQLEKVGSSLKLFHAVPVDAFKLMFDEYEVLNVYANNDYEPAALERDHKIEKLLKDKGVGFHRFKDHVIFEEDEVVKNDGKPYTVFTPYSRRWGYLFTNTQREAYSSEKYMDRFLDVQPLPFPAIEELGFTFNYPDVPPPEIPEEIIRNYNETRDFPAIRGTTRLGIHLRYGTLSIRELAMKADALSDVFLKELMWREFFIAILWHFPYVASRSFKPQFENIRWRNDEREFELWCRGMTGYPMVDAGMREMNATGFMHNRVRMVVAGFLTKHLLIDWRWGEAVFAEKLLDYELASNNGNWQWAASTGCDGAPWFRVFNPHIQQKKFDPQNEYANRWIPEAGTAQYPTPIVDHKTARERALRVYKAAF